jgi:hypothetical protein
MHDSERVYEREFVQWLVFLRATHRTVQSRVSILLVRTIYLFQFSAVFVGG